jgi:hypothetical protein
MRVCSNLTVPCRLWEDSGKRRRKRELRKHTQLRPKSFKMSSLRLLASAARRATTNAAYARRGYAEVSDKLKLSLALPHKV